MVCEIKHYYIVTIKSVASTICGVFFPTPRKNDTFCGSRIFEISPNPGIARLSVFLATRVLVQNDCHPKMDL